MKIVKRKDGDIVSKRIVIWIIVLVIISFGIYLFNRNANANECWKDCKPTPIPTISVLPQCEEWGDDCPTPKVTVTPTAGPSATPAPSVASPSAVPTPFIYPTPTEGSGGYFNDNLGCGTHSCISGPASINNMPSAAPATGRAMQ